MNKEYTTSELIEYLDGNLEEILELYHQNKFMCIEKKRAFGQIKNRLLELDIKKEWLKAIRLMVWNLKNIMENDNGESYDEEYYINKLNNIIENIDNKLKRRR